MTDLQQTDIQRDTSDLGERMSKIVLRQLRSVVTATAVCAERPRRRRLQLLRRLVSDGDTVLAEGVPTPIVRIEWGTLDPMELTDSHLVIARLTKGRVG